MDSNFIIAQCIGIIGVICFIISFQIKSNKVLYAAQAVGCIALGLQFLLLGGTTGAYNLAIMVIRNLALIKYNDWKWLQNKVWVVIISSINFIIMILTWAGPVSIFAFTAMLGSNIGMWTNNAMKIRLANLVCISPSWLIYDFIVGAYAGMLNETILLASILLSIYRYGWKAMSDPNSEFQK